MDIKRCDALPPLSASPDFGDTFKSDVHFKFRYPYKEDIKSHNTADGDHGVCDSLVSPEYLAHSSCDSEVGTSFTEYDVVKDIGDNSVVMGDLESKESEKNDKFYEEAKDESDANSFASSMCFDADNTSVTSSRSKDFIDNDFVEKCEDVDTIASETRIDKNDKTNKRVINSDKRQALDVIDVLNIAVDTLEDVLVNNGDEFRLDNEKEKEFYREFEEENMDMGDFDIQHLDKYVENELKNALSDDPDIGVLKDKNVVHNCIDHMGDCDDIFKENPGVKTPDEHLSEQSSKNANNNIETLLSSHKQSGSHDRNFHTKPIPSPITPSYRPRPSPYHRAFTPLSATPTCYSPAFKTPIQTVGKKPGCSSTPSSKFVTLQSQVYNPFEAGMLERLYMPVFSPSVFTKMSTPSSCDSKEFRWSIENAAILNPVDIDETSYQSPFTMRKDQHKEMSYQQAIRHFFASNIIAPSPYQPPQPHRLPATPAHNGQAMPVGITPDFRPEMGKKPKNTQDASSQTVLTLPLNLDINAILGEYMTYKGDQEQEQEVLSTSTLRRKLFFQGDTSCIASPSPVKQSPESGNRRNISFGHMTKNSPASDHFSSSPIAFRHSPTCQRTSVDNGHMMSPDLSPVKTIAAVDDFKNSNHGSFLSSPAFVGHKRISPHAHPQTSPAYAYNGLHTPDMSPINSTQNNREPFATDVSPIRNSESFNYVSPMAKIAKNFDINSPPNYICDNQQFQTINGLNAVPFTDLSPIQTDFTSNPSNNLVNPFAMHQTQFQNCQNIRKQSISPISVNTSNYFQPMSPINSDSHPNRFTPNHQPIHITESRSASPVFAPKKPTITPPQRLAASHNNVNHSPPLLPLSDYLDFSPSGVSTPDKRKERSHVASSSTTTPNSAPSLTNHPSQPHFSFTNMTGVDTNNTSVFMENDKPSPYEPLTNESLTTFDLSLSADTSDHDPSCQSSNHISQDTGYQTSSLQSTNLQQTSSLQTTQDSGQHSNLTTHFNGLPFKSFMDAENYQNTDNIDGNGTPKNAIECCQYSDAKRKGDFMTENLDCCRPKNVGENREYRVKTPNCDIQKPQICDHKHNCFADCQSYTTIDRMVCSNRHGSLPSKSKSLCDFQSLYKNFSTAELNFNTEQHRLYGFEQYRPSKKSSLADCNAFFTDRDNEIVSNARRLLTRVSFEAHAPPMGMEFSESHKSTTEISVRSTWSPASHSTPEESPSSASLFATTALPLKFTCLLISGVIMVCR